MSKSEFLLRVAIKAMSWGEGADFEMTELICYSDQKMIKAFCELYEVEWVTEENEKEAEKPWTKALSKCQREAVAYLKILLDKEMEK